jgi:hypothetical protein
MATVNITHECTTTTGAGLRRCPIRLASCLFRLSRRDLSAVYVHVGVNQCAGAREEFEMPVAYIDITTGVDDGAKKKIFTELYEAIHQAWPIPDTRVLIREWPNATVSQDGRIEDVPMRPICTLAVPPGLELDAKRRLIRQISNTLGEACGREVEEIRLPSGTTIDNNWVLTFFWELALDTVALGDLLATENPLVLENLPPQ